MHFLSHPHVHKHTHTHTQINESAETEVDSDTLRCIFLLQEPDFHCHLVAKSGIVIHDFCVILDCFSSHGHSISPGEV